MQETQEMRVLIPGAGKPPGGENGMLAWEIPWTVEPGGL